MNYQSRWCGIDASARREASVCHSLCGDKLLTTADCNFQYCVNLKHQPRKNVCIRRLARQCRASETATGAANVTTCTKFSRVGASAAPEPRFTPPVTSTGNSDRQPDSCIQFPTEPGVKSSSMAFSESISKVKLSISACNYSAGADGDSLFPSLPVPVSLRKRPGLLSLHCQGTQALGKPASRYGQWPWRGPGAKLRQLWSTWTSSHKPHWLIMSLRHDQKFIMSRSKFRGHWYVTVLSLSESERVMVPVTVQKGTMASNTAGTMAGCSSCDPAQQLCCADASQFWCQSVNSTVRFTAKERKLGHRTASNESICFNTTPYYMHLM